MLSKYVNCFFCKYILSINTPITGPACGVKCRNESSAQNETHSENRIHFAVLSACGGGGADSTVSQTSTGFQVEGVLAQKGPLLKNSRVTIAELNPLNYQPAGLSYDLITKDNCSKYVVLPSPKECNHSFLR